MGGLERVAPKVALLPAAFFPAYEPASAVPKTLRASCAVDQTAVACIECQFEAVTDAELAKNLRRRLFTVCSLDGAGKSGRAAKQRQLFK
jgi:hypothetical protein